MYLLYLDESGTGRDQPFFILAGLSVPESQAHWIEQDLNQIVEQIAAQFSPEKPSHQIELHGTQIHTGNKFWRRIEVTRRKKIIIDSLRKKIIIDSLFDMMITRRNRRNKNLDSKNSCLIQLADLVTYSLHQNYNQGFSDYYEIIANCFDYDSGQKNGFFCLGA
jgi:hypothetical protein